MGRKKDPAPLKKMALETRGRPCVEKSSEAQGCRLCGKKSLGDISFEPYKKIEKELYAICCVLDVYMLYHICLY